MKHFDVSFFILCKFSQKVHGLEMLYSLMFPIESFLSFFLCFTEKIIIFFSKFLLILDLVIKE